MANGFMKLKKLTMKSYLVSLDGRKMVYLFHLSIA